MNLYQIDTRLQEAFEASVDPETGEILDKEMAAMFEQLQIDRDTKIENICLYIKNLKSDAAALKAEKEAFTKRQKAAEKKAESLTKYLKGYLHGQKFKTARTAVYFRKSKAVEVTDITGIPARYMTIADPEPDKNAIKNALSKGEDIPGARIVENTNMIIK